MKIILTILSFSFIGCAALRGEIKAYPGEEKPINELSSAVFGLYETGPSSGDPYATLIRVEVDGQNYDSFFKGEGGDLRGKVFQILPGKKNIKVAIEYGDNDCKIESNPYFDGMTINPGVDKYCDPEANAIFECKVAFSADSQKKYEIQLSDSGTLRGPQEVSIDIASLPDGLAISSKGNCRKIG